MRRLMAGTLAGVMLLGGGAAAAEEDEIIPEAVPQVVYFHCEPPAPAQNLAVVNSAVTWNTTPPSQSVQAGAGCGFVDPVRSGTNQENVYDAVFKGLHTGNLDSMTLRLADMGVGAGRTGENQQLEIRVSIDGKSMFDTVIAAPSPLDPVLGPPQPVPAAAKVEVTPVQANMGVTSSLDVTITDLGFMVEHGPGKRQREVLITVNNLSEATSMWVFDTTEVPSGITFNPPRRADAFIAATTPGGPSS